MIEFKQVSKSFGVKVVLDRITFSVKTGEILFIIGRSGMGKSVLLKNIVGLLHPDSGEIWVDDQEVSRLPEADYFDVRKKCGMVFQHPALLESDTVFENVAFGLRAHRLCKSENELREKVAQTLALVHLSSDIMHRYPPEISFSMQKRVSIARTLVLEPKYLLFDEPTTAQDPVVTNSITRLIYNLSKELNVTSIVVSHDMHCALEIASRILLVDKGRIVAEGTPEAMLHSAEPIVQDFMVEAKERLLVPNDR